MLHGVERSGLMDKIILTKDYPAKVAGDLLSGQIDVGLVPVAIIPKLAEAHLVSDYCIGCDGEVASVAIFSDVPMEEIKTVLLDYQSRTSVQLAQILLREYWQQPVELEDAGTDFIDRIGGTTAGLIIGDRALAQLNKGQYVYDLGTAWKAHTGLPFVFATWVANKPLDADFIDAFNMANAYGINHIDEVLADMDYPAYDMHTYYTQNISYSFDEAKRKGMALFLQKLQANQR